MLIRSSSRFFREGKRTASYTLAGGIDTAAPAQWGERKVPMNEKIIHVLPTPRGIIALPQRGTRPMTAVDKVKAKLDPLLMARMAGVLVETNKSD